MSLRGAWGAGALGLFLSWGCAGAPGDAWPRGARSSSPNTSLASPTAHAAASSNGPSIAASGATASASTAARPGWVPQKTYALVVGVLTFEDKSIASFSDRHRKDRELADTLLERGVPRDHLTVLLDADATAEAVFAALEKTAKAAQPGSTLLFYYAGHGDKAKDGAISFVSFDASPKRPDAALSLARVEQIVSRDFGGDTVMLLADCCFSGGLGAVAEHLRAGGKRALSLTSAEASNTSTENWTYTQTLVDGLRGDALADHDGDGFVSVKELADEEREAMKARERQRSGASIDGFGDGFAIARRAPEVRQGPSVAKGAASPLAPGSYVEADRRGRGSGVARVLSSTGAELEVQFYDYSDKDTVRIPSAEVRPIRFTSYAVGAKLQVYWGGKKWRAEVTRTDGDFAFITYPGWPSFWDEWILSDRVADEVGAAPKKGAYAKGDAVSVMWRGKYWDAHVSDAKGGRYLIRYDGYDASWDEWVPAARMKPR